MGSEESVSHSWLFRVTPTSLKMKSSMGEIGGSGGVRICMDDKEPGGPCEGRSVYPGAERQYSGNADGASWDSRDAEQGQRTRRWEISVPLCRVVKVAVGGEWLGERHTPLLLDQSSQLKICQRRFSIPCNHSPRHKLYGPSLVGQRQWASGEESQLGLLGALSMEWMIAWFSGSFSQRMGLRRGLGYGWISCLFTHHLWPQWPEQGPHVELRPIASPPSSVSMLYALCPSWVSVTEGYRWGNKGTGATRERIRQKLNSSSSSLSPWPF